MNTFTIKLAAGATLVSLGGLAGFALKDNHQAASAAAQKQVPVEVRTQVIRRTVRIHRRPKAPRQAPAAAASAAASPPTRAQAPPPPVVAAAPVKANAPLRTRTSGAGGAGREREHEGERSENDD